MMKWQTFDGAWNQRSSSAYNFLCVFTCRGKTHSIPRNRAHMMNVTLEKTVQELEKKLWHEILC